MRFSKEPPYLSVRRLKNGEAKLRRRPSCAILISMPSYPDSTRLRVETANPSMVRRMSCSSIALVVCVLDGSGIWVGAHSTGGGCSSDVCPPWFSCAKIRAPWPCTASVVRRKGSITAGSQAATYLRDICPSGIVAMLPSTISPAPPQARSSWYAWRSAVGIPCTSASALKWGWKTKRFFTSTPRMRNGENRLGNAALPATPVGMVNRRPRGTATRRRPGAPCP